MPAFTLSTVSRVAAPAATLRPSRAFLRVVTVRAALLPTEPSSTRLLPLLSDLVQAQASVARFERLAGRSAMVGAAVALVTEALLPTSGGLFGAVAASTGATAEVGAAAIFLLCCSVGLAASLQRPFASHRLLEPVIASLTSKRRSFSGVSGQNATVDGALDSALDSVFHSRFIMENYLLQEDEKYI